MGMTWGWVQFLCTRFLWTWIFSSWLILTVRNGNKPIYNTVNESPNKIIRFWVWVACRRTRATTASLDPVWHHTNTQGKIYELFMLSLLYPIAQFASYWLYLNFDMFALSLSYVSLGPCHFNIIATIELTFQRCCKAKMRSSDLHIHGSRILPEML